MQQLDRMHGVEVVFDVDAILYGVTGEAMGTRRALKLCASTARRGTRGRSSSAAAHAFLSRFPDVVEIAGLTIRHVDGRMDRDGTLGRNVLAAPDLATNVRNISTR